jgi:iron complex outermembrane receptor protein
MSAPSRQLVFLTLLCVPALQAANPAAAQEAPRAEGEAPLLDAVVVTATRSEADPFEVPASIDSVDVEEALRLGASPAELLDGVPGVVARDRHNYAQDTQIAIRGFGARSTFGIRGVRLYTDGIPATQPDGQGQVSHFNLDSAARIEVLRGPFSALYGNASGGVIQLFTADGVQPSEWRVGAVGGSDGTLRGGVNFRGASDGFDANLDYSHFQTDGYRAHSRARRDSLNAKIGVELGNGGKLTLLGNVLRQPDTQDPLGLTWEQFQEDPHQTASQAIDFNTRKRASQAVGGAILDLPLSEHDSLRIMGYGGTRAITQFLSIPLAPQEAPRHAGGVVDLDTGFGGTDLRWARRMELGGRTLEFSAGLAADRLDQRRRGFENFVGEQLGITGRLRRDEAIDVRSFDQHAQLDWDLAERWRLLAGARHSKVRMQVHDDYIAAGNPDDSGRVEFSQTTPVAGLMFRASEALHLYASYGRGFETPTITEVAYRADGGSGLAFDLQPVTSDNTELGAKWRRGGMQAQLAWFETRSDDELAVATSGGGRTTYQNIGSSRRRGAELAVDWNFAHDWRMAFAYSHIDARFTSDFLGCSARCTSPDTLIESGARIPGVPRDDASLALRWQPAQGWNAGIDASHSGDMVVNDFGTARAPGYTLFGAEAGYRWQSQAGALRAFVRVDNLADRDYVGSAIVNDGNGRYFEPGPGRSWLLGLEWRRREP